METTPATGGYTGTGDLVQEGLWRADVLVRTHAGEGVFRAVPIVFLVGLEPAVLSAPAIDTQYGPAVLRLDSTPGPLSGASGKSGPHADVASALEGWQPGCRASGGGSCPNMPDAPLSGASGMFAAPRCPEAVVLQWCLPERMPWPDVRVICRMHHLATLAVRLRPGLRVRYLITMSDMSPQASDAQARAGSWYRGVIVPPMDGNMNLAVQVWEGGTWRTARMTVCQVDNAYALHLLL